MKGDDNHMKMTDIIELARLGYKPSDIKELLSMEPETATDDKTKTEPEPEPETKKDPEPDAFEKLARKE